jgi:hypothetical protein
LKCQRVGISLRKYASRRDVMECRGTTRISIRKTPNEGTYAGSESFPTRKGKSTISQIKSLLLFLLSLFDFGVEGSFSSLGTATRSFFVVYHKAARLDQCCTTLYQLCGMRVASIDSRECTSQNYNPQWCSSPAPSLSR